MSAAASLPSSAASRRHPPYKEMIFRAVDYLSDRRGSSRIAIAKFIAAAYSDLPPAHDALLFIHLRRLKNQGLLSMINHSYCLPATAAASFSSAPLPNSSKRPRGRPRKTPSSNPKPLAVGWRKMTVIADDDDAAAASVVVSAEKRKRGRPRKTAALPSPPMGEDGEVAGDAVKALDEKRRKRGRPRKTALLHDLSADSIGTQKRKRGRPRVVRAAIDSPAVLGLAKSLEHGIGSDTLIEKGKPGMQREVDTAVSSLAMVEDEEVLTDEAAEPPAVLGLAKSLEHGFGSGSGSVCGAAKSLIEMRRSCQPSPAMVELGGSEKRKSGRPKKVVQFRPIFGATSVGKRKPGRPRMVLQSGLEPTAGAAKSLVNKRKRGRPRKVSLPILHNSLLQSPGKVVVESVEKRKPGRPRKAVVEVEPGYASMPHPVSTSVEKRKRGRPRKVLAPTSSVMAVDGSAELLSPVHLSFGKVVGEVEPVPDPVPAALNLLDSPNEPVMSGDDNDTMLNLMQQSSKKAAGEMKEGVNTNASIIDCTGREDKTKPPAFLNSVL